MPLLILRAQTFAMNVSSASSYVVIPASARLHSSGCGCAMCMPQPVQSPPVPVAADGKDARGLEATESSGTISKASTESEQDVVRKLRVRDREVRQHEQAHLSAAGGLALSGASYTYQRGPDGVNYAIGGEVRIDTSPGRTPEETLEKAKVIERAALAPRNPSDADRSIAAQARSMAQEAQAAVQAQRSEALSGSDADEPASTSETPAPNPDEAAGEAVLSPAASDESDPQRRLVFAYGQNVEASANRSRLSAYA